MTSENFVVPPLSWDAIATVAEKVRSMLGIENVAYVPIVDALERVLDQRMNFIQMEIGTYSEMDGADGLTDPDGKFIMIREDVYESAIKGEGRARFTIAHELGHYFLHTGIPLMRCGKGDGVAAYRKSEPQANQFAAELLMPRSFIFPGITKRDLITRHGVSDEAAHHRITFLSTRGYDVK